MDILNFDNGIKEYQINNGVLRFNPGDPNVYSRFLESAKKIRAIEANLTEQARAQNDQDDGTAALELLIEADKQMKDVLTWVFGEGNDFDKILGGVNLLAVAGNGERVVTNLFGALQPILVAGAESCAKQQIGDAVQQAKQNRAQRRAQR